MAKALTVDDVILGEAVRGTAAERYRDMLGIASVIANRSRMLGVTPQEVVARQSEFNAYGKALPSGVEAYRDLAREALREVETAGPVHGATFYATPAAKDNLPRGLREEVRTTGHVYFSDPQQRSINTAVGYRQPAPIPVQSRVPAPTFAERLPAPPATALAYAPASQAIGAAQVLNNVAADPRGLPRSPVGQVASAPIGPQSFRAASSLPMSAPSPSALPQAVRDRMAPTPMAAVPTPAPRPQAAPMTMPARPVSRTPEWGAPKQTAPTPQMASLPQPVMDRMAGFPQGLPQRAAPLPDAVSYGLMAESLRSRGVMGLDGRMAADQPRSLPTRAPDVPTPTFASQRPSVGERMAGFAAAPAPQMARSVPAPTFADRLEQTAEAMAPARSNFAGPAGSFRSMQAPSEMAEIGSRVAPVSVAERMGLPNAPTPSPAPRGMMSRIGDAIVSPAKASTMPDHSPAVRDRMGGFAPTQAVDMAGYKTAPAAPTTRMAEAAPRGATGSWGPRGATGSWADTPAPRETPTRQMTSPRAMEAMGAPSLDNFAMPQTRASVPSAPPTPAPQAAPAPSPAPAPSSSRRSDDAWGGMRDAVSRADPLTVADKATRTAMQPEAQPSFAERAFGSLGGLGGVAGSIVGGAVGGPLGMVAGNLVGRQISRPTAQVSTGGNHGTGTRSSAANAALNAGWSGFGPMTAAQERAARNARSGSSSRGKSRSGGGWSNEASSSAIGGRTTSYSDGSTSRSGSGRSGSGNTGGLF